VLRCVRAAAPGCLRGRAEGALGPRAQVCQYIAQSLANDLGLRAQVFQYIMQSLANYRAMHMRIKALEVDPRGAGYALQVSRPAPPGPPAADSQTCKSAVCVGQRKPAPHARWSRQSQRGRPWAELLDDATKSLGQHHF